MGRVNHVLTRLNFPYFCRAHSYRMLWAKEIDFSALGGRRLRELMCLYNALYPLLLAEAGSENGGFIKDHNLTVQQVFAMIQKKLPEVSEEGDVMCLREEELYELRKSHYGPILLMVSIGMSNYDWKRLDLIPKLLNCVPTASIFERTLKLLESQKVKLPFSRQDLLEYIRNAKAENTQQK